MSYTYTTIHGERVQTTVAAAFELLRAAFKAQFGLDLIVSSGVRTWAKQMELYEGWANRRPGYFLALHPDDPKAYHVEINPRGPRALDLRDSGADNGVTVLGTIRSNWLAANAGRFGFTNAGHFFSPREAWHYEFTGALDANVPAYPLPAGWYFGPQSGPTESVSGFHGNREGLRVWQQRMADRGWHITPDGLYGDNTRSITIAFQREKGLNADGLIGPATWAAAWTAPIS